MTVIRDGPTIRLQGVCRVEDAEPLAFLLQAISDSTLDLSACEGLHAAVVQAILAFHPQITGLVDDPFLRDRLLPAMFAENGSSVQIS